MLTHAEIHDLLDPRSWPGMTVVRSGDDVWGGGGLGELSIFELIPQYCQKRAMLYSHGEH